MRRLPKLLVLLAIIGATTLLAAAGVWKLHNARGFQLAGELVHRVDTEERVVALTFDDGPSEYVHHILPVLREHGARATFYVIGEALEAHPEAARKVLEEGHELGNHSYSHRRMVLKPRSFIRAEVERTDSLILRVGHRGPITFRPPYGKKLLGLPFYLARTGRTTVMWDVEPDNTDDDARPAGEIVRHALERVRPGSIVLLHPWYESRETTRQALAPSPARAALSRLPLRHRLRTPGAGPLTACGRPGEAGLAPTGILQASSRPQKS
jgi:peptidoglycan-N-acetylglucosamine deacetylase